MKMVCFKESEKIAGENFNCISIFEIYGNGGSDTEKKIKNLIGEILK